MKENSDENELHHGIQDDRVSNLREDGQKNGKWVALTTNLSPGVESASEPTLVPLSSETCSISFTSRPPKRLSPPEEAGGGLNSGFESDLLKTRLKKSILDASPS